MCFLQNHFIIILVYTVTGNSSIGKKTSGSKIWKIRHYIIWLYYIYLCDVVFHNSVSLCLTAQSKDALMWEILAAGQLPTWVCLCALGNSVRHHQTTYSAYSLSVSPNQLTLIFNIWNSININVHTENEYSIFSEKCLICFVVCSVFVWRFKYVPSSCKPMQSHDLFFMCLWILYL